MKSRVLALLFLAAAATPALADPPSVSVTGEARAEAKPDIATIGFEIVSERPTAAEASGETAKSANATIEMLKGANIDAKDIMTTGVSIYPTFSEQRDPKSNAFIKSVVTGYRASQRIRVRLRDIERAGAIIGASVQSGALYDDISYDLSDRDQRLDALRGKAAANARDRARLYAEGLDMKLGPVLKLDAGEDHGSEMQMKSMAPRALAAVGPAALQIEPGTLTLSESVNATFELISP